jgi:transketolase
MEARDALIAEGLAVAVVSLPCWERFESQTAQYRQAVLGDAPRIAIEAAGEFGWDRYLRVQDVFIGMQGFGASAPAPDLYHHFGITPEAICETAHRIIG